MTSRPREKISFFIWSYVLITGNLFLVLLLLFIISVRTERVRPRTGIVRIAPFNGYGDSGEIGLDSNTEPPTADPTVDFVTEIEPLRAGTGSLFDNAYFRNSCVFFFSSY